MVSTPRAFSSLSRAIGVGHALVLVAPGFGVVLHDLGGHDEHVLVHQRDAEIGGVDRSSRSRPWSCALLLLSTSAALSTCVAVESTSNRRATGREQHSPDFLDPRDRSIRAARYRPRREV